MSWSEPTLLAGVSLSVAEYRGVSFLRVTVTIFPRWMISAPLGNRVRI